jgi:hypothetical protein
MGAASHVLAKLSTILQNLDAPAKYVMQVESVAGLWADEEIGGRGVESNGS